MPVEKALRRARQDLREGKSPSTAAGEFIRVEMEQMGKGKHSARSPKQAIAIGLSQARRAGIPLAPQPGKSRTQQATKKAVAAGKRKRG